MRKHERKGARSAPSTVALIGRLEEFALATLLTVLELERRTGVLEVRGPHEQGRLYLREGRLVRADLRGGGTGREAVFTVLALTSGWFVLRRLAVEGDDELGATTTHLLMLAAQRADELAA